MGETLESLNMRARLLGDLVYIVEMERLLLLGLKTGN